MANSQTLTRYGIGVILGFSIILPLMNQNGVISIYEAITGIWLLFLIPAYFLYRSFRKNAPKKTSFYLSFSMYLMGSTLYSLVEPIIAGYNVYPYTFLIPIPTSFIVMLPSIVIRNRTFNAKPKSDIQSDPDYTEYLRVAVEKIDQNPPEVFISPTPVKIGSSFVTHTDGRSARVLIHSEALDKFSEDEIRSAVVKKYFEFKQKSSLKFIYRINFLALFILEGAIILTSLVNYVTTPDLKIAMLVAMLVLVFGSISSFPFAARRLIFLKERVSDVASAIQTNDTKGMKNYIIRSTENYVVSPLATGRRYERTIKFQKNLAARRISYLESQIANK